MSPHEHSWALMTTYEDSGALIGTQEQLRLWLHDAIINSLELMHVLIEPRHHDHEWPWALMRLIWAQERPWELIRNQEYSWHQGTMLMSDQGWSWLIISIHEHSRALISGHKHSLSWSHSVTKLMSIHGHSAMVLWTLIAPWALMAPYSWCSWVLMSIHECSWVPMSAQ